MNMRLVITTLLGAVSGAVVAATAAPHGGFLLWCASALLAGAVCAALAPHEAVTITASGLPEAPFKDLANRLESLERVLPAALEAQTQALSQGLKPLPAAAVDLSPLVEELRKLQSSSKSDEAVVLRLGALETALGADLRALGSKLQATSPEVHVDLSGLESMLRSEIASLGSKLESRESAVVEAPVVNVDLSGLESMLRSEIANLGSKLESRESAVVDAPVVNVDLSGLESMLRSEIASLGSKLEFREPAVVDAPVVNVDLSGLESMLRSEIANLGSKLEVRESAVAEAPVVNVDLSGLESMLRHEIVSLGSKFESRESAVVDAPVVNVDLSGLESMLRSEIANLGSKLEVRESAVAEAPVVNVDLSGLESMLRSEIASLGSKLEVRESAVTEAPVVNVDLSGLESVFRSEITSLGSKFEVRESAVAEAPVVNVDLSGLESMLRSEIANLGSKLEVRESVGATSDDEAIVLRLGALETALGADLRALGEKFQQASPEVSLDLGALESIVKQGNERVASAIASTRVDLSGLDALRKDITALFELMAERPVSGESAPASVVVDFAPVIDKLQAIELQLSRPAPSPIVEVPPVDLSSLSEGLKAIQEEVFSLRDDLASAKPATEGVAAGFDERVPTALEAVRHQLESGSTRALELQGDIYLRLETLREEIAKQADLLVGQSLALEALREDETKHFQSREECDDLRHQALVQALGSVPAGEPRAMVASVPGAGLQLQDGALERILEGLVAVAPLGETLVAHGAQLASLTGHLETAGTLMAVVPEKLEGSVRILEEALSTLRANQVEFGASVEVFTRAAEGMAGGLADKGMAPGTQTAMDGLMEQKAFLDALGKVLSGFSQSLSGVLGESSQRTQEVLVELCARLEGPQA